VEKSVEYDGDKYTFSSFISAIDEDEHRQANTKRNLRLNPLVGTNHLEKS
jgi:hypothetical protein